MNMEKNYRFLRLFGIIGLVSLTASCLLSSQAMHIGPSLSRWLSFAFALVSVVQAGLLASSRLRSAGIMWLCVAGRLGMALILPVEAHGSYECRLVATASGLQSLLETCAYFVLARRNQGRVRTGLLLLAIVAFFSVLYELVTEIYSFTPAAKLFTGLSARITPSVTFIACLIFATHCAASDERDGTYSAPHSPQKLLRAAAVLGLLFASYCVLARLFWLACSPEPYARMALMSACGAIMSACNTIFSLLFCAHFLLLLLAGRRMAGCGIAGSFLIFTEQAIPLESLGIFGWGDPSIHYPFIALSAFASGLVIASLVMLRDLFPRWARWCIAVWCVQNILSYILMIVPVASKEHGANEQLLSIHSWIALICAAALAAAYVGMLLRRPKPCAAHGDEEPPSADRSL